jgi:hypothetical protein
VVIVPKFGYRLDVTELVSIFGMYSTALYRINTDRGESPPTHGKMPNLSMGWWTLSCLSDHVQG